DTGRCATRRDFLKNSALFASAAVAGSGGLVRNAYAAGGDTIKVGMIGCGGRCTGAAAEALTADPGARLVAMCDIIEERIKSRRERLKQQFKDQVAVDDDHCFTGFDGYKHVIEACDVVLIANAAKFHPFHTLQALKAGRHVFVEKPHGIDPLGMKVLKQAVDLAKEQGLSLVSGLQSRYHSGYQETIQRIYDGAIGDIICIEENFLRAPYQITPREPWMSELVWQCSTQYHFRWLSGDDVTQSLVHNLDRANWVLHNTPPGQVSRTRRTLLDDGSYLRRCV
ncbi:MAG TPA: twin-arginine translocation signal domain-containing protein, partial [Candidatus Hydrogenedentes bacterium]|nr:twin-arginine translocation signal domain-containing protein [Candidatus Hydrogenedentota bacterium]